MRLIKWSKLPILGSAVLAGYAIGRATSSTGAGVTPVTLKMRAFLKSSKVQKSLSGKMKSARKLAAGGLRLTSDLLSVSADLLNPESTWARANKQLKKK